MADNCQIHSWIVTMVELDHKGYLGFLTSDCSDIPQKLDISTRAIVIALGSWILVEQHWVFCNFRATNSGMSVSRKLGPSEVCGFASNRQAWRRLFLSTGDNKHGAQTWRFIQMSHIYQDAIHGHNPANTQRCVNVVTTLSLVRSDSTLLQCCYNVVKWCYFPTL